MSDLIDELLEDDYTLIDSWMKCHTRNYCGNRTYLREWADKKYKLYQAFGQKFILRKHVSLEKPADAIKNDLIETCTGYQTPFFYINNFLYTTLSSEDYYNINTGISNVKSWAKNFNEGNTCDIYIKNKFVKIPHGCKPIRMIGKLLNELDAPQDIKDYYEQFRIAHSMCLNQKRFEGDLCLSIHPMDFMTMSENDSGWSSCMNWDDGEYHLGTVECMNSPSIVVAYLDNVNAPMDVCGYPWSNKMWRQLLCFNTAMLLGNKQYPYSSDVLQNEAMSWLKSLLENYSKEYHYSDKTYPIFNQTTNCLPCGTIYINLSFNVMYNDIYGTRNAYLNFSSFEGHTNYIYKFGGYIICAQCGNIIDGEDADPAQIYCPECLGSWRCEDCGEYQPEDANKYCVDGLCICQDCYENHTLTCDCCGETHYFKSNINQMEFIIDDDDNTDYLNLCETCYRDSDFLEQVYGPEDEDGFYKLINFSNQAFDYMSIYSSYFLRRKRDRLRSA